MDIAEAEQILSDLISLAEGANETNLAIHARRLAEAVRGWEEKAGLWDRFGRPVYAGAIGSADEHREWVLDRPPSSVAETELRRVFDRLYREAMARPVLPLSAIVKIDP